MLTRAVTDGVMRLSPGEREELATFLIESLRDEALDVEEEIVLDAIDDDDDDDREDAERHESAASQV
jgi:hypothetical protein